MYIKSYGTLGCRATGARKPGIVIIHKRKKELKIMGIAISRDGRDGYNEKKRKEYQMPREDIGKL